MKRIESIDFLRGLALISMFITHGVLFTAPKSDHPLGWALSVNLMGDWGAGLFAFLLGMSLSISIERHRGEGMPEREIGIRTLKRAALIFVFGFFFPILIWGLYDGLYWDVLTMLAASIAILWFFRSAKPWVFFGLAAVAVLLAPHLFQWFDGPIRWAAGHYKAPLTMMHLLKGFLGTGNFPLIPWTAFTLIGFGIARLNPSPRKLLIVTVLLALGSVTLRRLVGHVSAASPISEYVAGYTFYPLSTPFFLLIISIVLMLYATARSILDMNPHPRRWMKLFKTISRYSFTLYVLHYAILIPPQRLVGWWITGDHEYFVQNSLTTLQGFVVGILLIPFLYWLCLAWDRVGGIFSMEWWLKKAVG